MKKVFFLQNITLCHLLILIRKYECISATDNLDENKIVNNITGGYNKAIRPASTIQMTIKMAIKQISTIDEKNQIMTSDAYFSAQWVDSRLRWDPADYGDNDYVLISATSLWMPDFYQINTANTNGYVTISGSNLALVDSNGEVYVVFYLSQSKTRCKLSIKYFPFDTQICSIVIGSWMMDTSVLNFTSDDTKIDKSAYTQNPVWDLKEINVNSIISSDRYFTFGKLLSNEDISYDFVLTRRPLYFIMNNIFPCLILNFVVILLFTLPFNLQVGSCKLNYE